MVIVGNSRTARGPSELTQVTTEPIRLVAVGRHRCCFDGSDTRRVMQHVCSDDMQNAEACQDSECPRLETQRWSPGAGAIENCHVQITFLSVWPGKAGVQLLSSDELQADIGSVQAEVGIAVGRNARCKRLLTACICGVVSEAHRSTTCGGSASRCQQTGQHQRHAKRGHSLANHA